MRKLHWKPSKDRDADGLHLAYKLIIIAVIGFILFLTYLLLQ
jgi:hypothetical protein